MPVIRCNGRVIAWSGIEAGPIQELNTLGGENQWMRYEAEIGDAAPELAKVIVRIDKMWRTRVPQLALTFELVEREIVAGFIKERVCGNYQPLDFGVENNFSISDDEMFSRYQGLRD